jgi:sterol desaturase/sphingolipid hydroxylase (fatty acid hydroxylase superfamily)
MKYEVAVRLGFFLGILTLMTVWEFLAPRRALTTPKSVRWPSNLLIVVIDTVIMKLVFPMAAVGMAALALRRGWGLLNLVELPGWLAFACGVVALDLIIYFQHVLFHAVPVLWRLHMVHHSDMDFDVSTGLRFHPLEILLSMGIKLAAVAALGPSPAAVLVFEVVLNGTSLFNHGNVRLPGYIDRALRLIVVTPDMHRVHHSIREAETNTNFGFNIPWWDRLFGTYRDQPEAGHTGMIIGLDTFRDFRRLTLPWLLVLPFTGTVGRYPLSRPSATEPADVGTP